MKRRDRDSFSDGGYWARSDRSGRAPSLREARDRDYLDHQPRRRGLIARLLNTRGNRP
ncbi:hypothetical protein V2J94_41650 [Streptomyces sp. DSM 41524]|uniref:Uncharacterized protein n=1 Tax=Streptomyces asiaticus subsp. ignotus TaxID=3098222 RepID=A0ABU7QA45_9ACTN|nr:hypothetical protein [Streptomyces sp. DSM 41524]